MKIIKDFIRSSRDWTNYRVGYMAVQLHDQEKWGRVTAGGKHLIKSTMSSVNCCILTALRHRVCSLPQVRFAAVVPLEEKQFFFSCYHARRTLCNFVSQKSTISLRNAVWRDGTKPSAWHPLLTITLNDKVITASGVYVLMTLNTEQ